MAAFLVVLAFVVPTTLVLNDQVNRHERQALTDQAGEIRSLLTVLVADVRASLTTVGVAAVNPGSPAVTVDELAAPLLQSKMATVAVLRVQGQTIRTLWHAGAANPKVERLSGWRTGFVRRALSQKSFVTHHDASIQTLAFAVPVPGIAGVVAYDEGPVDPQQVASGDSSPFRNLEVSLYSSSIAQPSELIFGASDHARGRVSLPFPVGADTWTVVARPTAPLDGRLAESLPWFNLVGGSVLALLVAWTVRMLSRRRAYADALVEERTAALRFAQKDAEQARERAEKASTAKSEFLSRMSHELRTPLNAILGFGQLLEMDDLTEKQARGVDQILQGGHHLLALVNEILDLARVESGRLSLTMEPVLVADVIRRAQDMISTVATDSGITVDIDDPGDLQVLADRQRALQIVLNLISNAVKFNRVGGRVEIRTREIDGRIRIEVTDSGPGIDESVRTEIFAPFERLPGNNAEGTGIGLALSRQLAEAMGATVDFSSTVGIGSTFWVEFGAA